MPTAEGFKDTPNWQWMSCKLQQALPPRVDVGVNLFGVHGMLSGNGDEGVGEGGRRWLSQDG